MFDIHGVFLYTILMKNNIIQFEEYRQKLKLQKKIKYKKHRHRYYVAIPKIKHRCVQGFHSSKKEFLKETVEIFKQLLTEQNAEFFFDCYKITKDSVKTTHWKEIENFAMKMTKQKYKL